MSNLTIKPPAAVPVPEPAQLPIPISQIIHLIPMPKEGWKTTEFWLTAASQLIAVGVLSKVVPVADAKTLQSDLGQFIPAMVAAIASAAPLVTYIISRIHVKTAVIPAVIPAPTPAPLPPPPQYNPLSPLPTPPAPNTNVLPNTWAPDHQGELIR